MGKKLISTLVSIRHLNGTVLESFVRPAVLVTDAYNALLSNQPPRRQRDQQFLGNNYHNEDDYCFNCKIDTSNFTFCKIIQTH